MTREELLQKIKENENVIVDFWAPWCNPCRMLAPILEEVKNELGVEVLKVNVDDNEALAHEYKIFNIPTLFIYKNGVLVNKSIGVKSKENIIEMLK